MQNPNEIENYLNSSISVKPVMVITAKEYISQKAIKSKFLDVPNSIGFFLSEMKATLPETVILHASVDIDPQLKQAIEGISWQLSFAEAIWSLIRSGFLLPSSSGLFEVVPHLGWTTAYQRSGGTSSGWSFPQWKVIIPVQVRLSPSYSDESQSKLSDADLYIRHLNLPGLHQEVREALEDAIRCFRADLYTPSLAMLAKAVEGALTEMGMALINSLPESDRPKVRRLEEALLSEFSSIAKKINAVLELYEKQDLFGWIAQKSGIRLDSFRGIIVWADHVREARNLVHYGSTNSGVNDYEKVAVLLLASSSHLKNIYTILSVAKEGKS